MRSRECSRICLILFVRMSRRLPTQLFRRTPRGAWLSLPIAKRSRDYYIRISCEKTQRKQDGIPNCELTRHNCKTTRQVSPTLSLHDNLIYKHFHIGVGTGVRFSKVTFETVAPLVGLDPTQRLGDIKTFGIYRSRIPTDLFEAIVMDMDVMLMQYCPFPDHDMEEARSRFFSPVKTLKFSRTP